MIVRKTLDEIKNMPIADELNDLKSMSDDKIDYSDIPVLSDKQIHNLKYYHTEQNSMIKVVMNLPKTTCFDGIDTVELQRAWCDEQK